MNPDTHIHRVAIAVELCDEAQGLMFFSRPQDFRVKASHWQYAEVPATYQSGDGHLTHYIVYAYARRWKGPGSQIEELNHDEHPTKDEIRQLVLNFANSSGLPVGSPDHQREPMAWTDPLKEDDFLDDSDNPADFKWWNEDDAEDDDPFPLSDEAQMYVMPGQVVDVGYEIRPTEAISRFSEITPAMEQQMSEVTGRVLSDQLTNDVSISIMQAWPLINAMRLAAEAPGIGPHTSETLNVIGDQLRDAIVERYPDSGPLFARPQLMGEQEFSQQALPILSDKTPINVQLTVALQWMLVSGIQTAVRHPEMDAYTLQALRSTARQFQGNIVQRHPDAGAILEMGWNPNYDYTGN